MADPPPRPPPRAGPALGAADGVRKDLQAAKDAALRALQTGQDPAAIDHNAFGSAWTHDFLNKKPWHPMNFRNRAKVWEHEQQKYEDEKRKYDAKKEFEAEQAYLKTISLLSPEEQEKYKQRQSVAWLYMKPPGFNDAAQVPKTQNVETTTATTAGGNNNATDSSMAQQQIVAENQQAPPEQQQQRQQQGRQQNNRQGTGGNYLAKVVGGFKAVAQKSRLVYNKNAINALQGSPPRGGFAPDAPNQKYVVPGIDIDTDDEEEAFKLAMMTDEERKRLKTEAIRRKKLQEKAAEEAKIQEAKAFLRAAGIALPDDDDDEDNSTSDDGNDSTGSGGTSSDEDSDSGTRKEKRHRKSKRRKKEKSKSSSRKHKKRRKG